MTLSPNFSAKSAVVLFALLTCFVCISGADEPAPEISNEDVDVGKNLPVAVLPVDNLSGMPAPLHDIRQTVIDSLKSRGVNILDEKALKGFISSRRIRDVGGITNADARAFREETGAGSVLITSLELYNEISPPKIALMSRLVSTGKKTSILWTNGSGMAGDDAPGILNLSLIEDPKTLVKKSVEPLTLSLRNYLSGQAESDPSGRKAPNFWPKDYYSSPILTPEMRYRLAALPFYNVSERKYAGEIVRLHFIRHLKAFKNLDVIEPGVEKQARLNLRIIMDDGLSLANVDVIFHKLEADLILTGKILDYQDFQGARGKPRVEFSALLIERNSREVVWSCRSYNDGDERVSFFNWGKINTAHSLASAMTQTAVGTIFQERHAAGNR